MASTKIGADFNKIIHAVRYIEESTGSGNYGPQDIMWELRDVSAEAIQRYIEE